MRTATFCLLIYEIDRPLTLEMIEKRSLPFKKIVSLEQLLISNHARIFFPYPGPNTGPILKIYLRLWPKIPGPKESGRLSFGSPGSFRLP